jgi:hypothetical protein
MKNRWIVIATLMAGLGVGTSARAATTCGINFDDYNALKGLYHKASDGFAWQTSRYSDSRCTDPSAATGDSRMNHPNCRMYEQSCGASTKIFVWNQNDTHYHMYFQDPAYSGNGTGCPTASHKVNGVCQAVDAAALQRYLGAHEANQWMEIGRTTDPISTLSPFAMYSVDVKVGPIQLWFKRTNGTVAGWNSLPQGNWLIPTGDVVAVWISNAAGSPAEIELWDFAVTVP